jgi:hypothetical protein
LLENLGVAVPLGGNVTAVSSWNAALASELYDALARLSFALVYHRHYLLVIKQISGSSSSSNTQVYVWESFTPGLVKPLVLMLLELHLLANDAALKLRCLKAITHVLEAAEAVTVHKRDEGCKQALAACKLSLLAPVLQLVTPCVQQTCGQPAAAAGSRTFTSSSRGAWGSGIRSSSSDSDSEGSSASTPPSTAVFHPLILELLSAGELLRGWL